MIDDDPRVRLELLIGHLADQLAPARELVDTLRLRSNASTITSGHLDHLCWAAGALCDRLGAIREEVGQLRGEADKT
jgi:hypothetical protein